MTDDNYIAPQDSAPRKTLRTEEFIALRDMVLAETEPCPLDIYRTLMRKLPKPTSAQIDNYVNFVAEAHSWYKHLPTLPPGIPFRFFLNPFSGYDRFIQPDGSVIHKERTSTSQRFHYTWMTTEEYRSRFGHLAYSCGNVGTQIFCNSPSGVAEYRDLPFFSAKDGELPIPVEIAKVGSVNLTAVVHTLALQEWVWTDNYPAHRKYCGDWPKETGGNATLQRILDVCNGKIEGDLSEILMPERRRLRQSMTDAVYRMLVMLYDEN